MLACGVNNSAAAGAVGCGVSSSSSATSTGCCLPPVVVQELFLQLLLLSPQLQRRPELQGLLLQVLLHLVATGEGGGGQPATCRMLAADKGWLAGCLVWHLFFTHCHCLLLMLVVLVLFCRVCS